jgi:hypothetical protein
LNGAAWFPPSAAIWRKTCDKRRKLPIYQQNVSEISTDMSFRTVSYSASQILHPELHFGYPRVVLEAHHLHNDAKLALLASRVSDRFAVEAIAAFRHYPGTERAYDDIMHALKALDAESMPLTPSETCGHFETEWLARRYGCANHAPPRATYLIIPLSRARACSRCRHDSPI